MGPNWVPQLRWFTQQGTTVFPWVQELFLRSARYFESFRIQVLMLEQIWTDSGQTAMAQMGFSEVQYGAFHRWTPTSSILMGFSWLFHYKPTIVGYPHLWKVPHSWMVYHGKSHFNGCFGGTPISGNLHMVPDPIFRPRLTAETRLLFARGELARDFAVGSAPRTPRPTSDLWSMDSPSHWGNQAKIYGKAWIYQPKIGVSCKCPPSTDVWGKTMTSMIY